MNRERSKGSYNPYTKEQWEKIKSDWNLYKNAIGLEGNLYVELKNQGLSEGDISKRTEEYRETRKNLIEDYRKEIGKNG